jgi:beta-fructofuranosidase
MIAILSGPHLLRGSMRPAVRREWAKRSCTNARNTPGPTILSPMTPNHRPAFHFLPERNWMNDPNGLIEWQGQTHLFYQYNPHGAFPDTIHWGHAVSADRVHWQHLPIALAPTPGGPDAGGCWTGSAVDDDGVPTVIYTGVHPQVVCLATSAAGASAGGAKAVGTSAAGASADGLLTWAKHPASPVISGPPAALAEAAQGDFRDPYVWREAGAWHLVIGSKDKNRGGLVLRYRSADLLHWDYVGVLLAGDSRQTQPFPTGSMWECPNYFELDGQRVLVYSAYSETEHVQYPPYYTASAQDAPFTPAAQGIVVHGPSFYAPQSLRLGDGRRMMWGWLKETRPRAAQVAEGWSGVMSLPLVLTWRPAAPLETPGAAGELGLAPAAELHALRREHWHFDNPPQVAAGAAGLLSAIEGDCLELEALCRLDPAADLGLRLRAAPGGQEQTTVVYQAAEQRLRADTRASSLDPDAAGGLYDAPLRLEPGEPLHLHIFLDRSVLEVFANGRVCLAARLYPTRADSLGLQLFSRGGLRLESLDVWKMGTIW